MTEVTSGRGILSNWYIYGFGYYANYIILKKESNLIKIK